LLLFFKKELLPSFPIEPVANPFMLVGNRSAAIVTLFGVLMAIRIFSCLALAAGALISSAPANAALKPGNYTVTITGSCDTFELTLDPDKVLVYGVHDLTACANPGTYTASGFVAKTSKTIIPPFTGAAWQVTSANDPNWIFSIDLVHMMIGVEEGTETGETGYGPAAITYTYAKANAAFAPGHPSGSRPFGSR